MNVIKISHFNTTLFNYIKIQIKYDQTKIIVQDKKENLVQKK